MDEKQFEKWKADQRANFENFRSQVRNEYDSFRKEGQKLVAANEQTKTQVRENFSKFRKEGQSAISAGQEQLKIAQKTGENKKAQIRNIFKSFRAAGRALLGKGGAGSSSDNDGVVSMDVGPRLIKRKDLAMGGKAYRGRPAQSSAEKS